MNRLLALLTFPFRGIVVRLWWLYADNLRREVSYAIEQTLPNILNRELPRIFFRELRNNDNWTVHSNRLRRDVLVLLEQTLPKIVMQELQKIDNAQQWTAMLESAKFVFENIPLHRRYRHADLRRIAIERAPEKGLLLEFRVFQGYWIKQIAAMTDRTIYGFNSFEGLPESWSTFDKGILTLGGLCQKCPPTFGSSKAGTTSGL